MIYREYNLSIYSILISYLDKLKKLKILNLILSYFEFLWIQFTGSNHIKRLPFLISSKLSMKFFIKIFGVNFYEQYEISKLYFTPSITLNNDFVVFIGDSHVEFYSRVNTNILLKNPVALHLGAVTLIGIDSIKDSNLNYIISFLNKIISKNKSKKFKIIWSLGTIDIRSSIYELRLRNVISSYDDIYSIFLKSLYLLDSKICIINKSLNFNNIKHLLLIPTLAHEKNICPNTVKELIYLRKKHDILTFGSLEDHVFFLNIFITVLENNSFNNFNYINSKIDFLDKSLFFDGIHVTCSNAVNKIFKNILSL